MEKTSAQPARSQKIGFLHHIRLVPFFGSVLGGILLLFALSAGLAGYFMWKADVDQRDVTHELQVRVGLSDSANYLREARLMMIHAGADSRIAEMDSMKKNLAAAQAWIKRSQDGFKIYADRGVKTAADRALDNEMNQRYNAYLEGMKPMLKYAQNGMFEAILNYETEQARTLDDAYNDVRLKVIDIRTARATQLTELAHNRTTLGVMFMIGAFVLAVLMTIITFTTLRRVVILPLQRAGSRIAQIASGDLTMTDEPVGRSEIGQLIFYMQKMEI